MDMTLAMLRRWLPLGPAIIGFALLACGVTPPAAPTPTTAPPAIPTATAAPPAPTLTPTPEPPPETVLNATRDGTLYQHYAGGLSNGAGQHLFVGTTAAGFLRRAVIAFDVASSIPAGSTITSVALTLDMSRTQGGDAVITLHRLLADWDEGSAVAPGNEGAGGPSVPGDVTWLHRAFDSLEWAEPGGDFLPTPHAHAPVAGRGEYTWESTPGMVADVQSWLEDPEANFGWLLKGNEEDRATAKRFGSRENVNPVARPWLTVEYIPPPGP